MIWKPYRGRISPLGLSIHARKLFTKLSFIIKEGVNPNLNWKSGGREKNTHERKKMHIGFLSEKLKKAIQRKWRRVLWFVVPCIFKYPNKTTNQMHTQL
jgi:hypothetical protein